MCVCVCVCVCVLGKGGDHWNKSKSHIGIYFEDDETYLDAYTFLVYFLEKKVA